MHKIIFCLILITCYILLKRNYQGIFSGSINYPMNKTTIQSTIKKVQMRVYMIQGKKASQRFQEDGCNYYA